MTTKLHVCSVSANYTFVFHLSSGDHYDALEERKRIETIYSEYNHNLLMDRAYEDDQTRALAQKYGFNVTIPTEKKL